ncbi:MAG: heme biosynthesis HemY N-terminal domain-containing protein [Vibrionaceae bacterium]
MIKLLLLVVVLVAGLFLGPQIAGNQGYVLLSLADQTIEMSVTTLGTLIFLLVIALFFIEFVIRTLLGLTGSTGRWLSARKQSRARQLTNTSLLKLFEGEWRQAENLAVKGAENSEASQINYLTAAQAAQNRGDIESRDHYLHQATLGDPDSFVTNLTRAKLQHQQGQYEEALASLQALSSQHPRNTMLLSLQKETLLQLKDWQGLLQLLPKLTKAEILTASQAEQLELQAQGSLITHIAEHKPASELLVHWNKLSRTTRQQTVLIREICGALIKKGESQEAFAILSTSLKKEPHETLIAQLAQLELAELSPVIALLEQLQRDKNGAAPHRALAQIYVRKEAWQEARAALEAALEIDPKLADVALLADVLEKLGDKGAIAQISQKALELTRSQNQSVLFPAKRDI